jgi:iduronate 2-sulfatase
MRKLPLFRLLGLAAAMSGYASIGVSSVEAASTDPARPNVVLIVCDDLNDYVEGFGGHPQTKTPHMAKLAESGVRFTSAYSNVPVCAPSRASFLTGIYAHTSGNLFWSKWYDNPVLKNSKTLMEFFQDAGYSVAGSGKLMHFHRASDWTEFENTVDYGPFAYDGTDRVAHPDVPMPFGEIGPVDGSYGPLENVPFADDGNPKSGWVTGSWKETKPFSYSDPENLDLTPDEKNAKWASERIQQFAADESGQPFFVGVGFIRPHTPLHVQQRYFDRFPLDELIMPIIKAGDADDTHYRDVFEDTIKGLKYFRMLVASYPDMETAILTFAQAYLASVNAVDECVGQVIDAVDNSALRENTIIIVTSDHGWDMGQKDYLFKHSPWEGSTRIPMIIRAPGVAKAGSEVKQPVSLIDLYPTLIDLCGIEADNRKNDKGAPLDGFSLRPLMEDPSCGEWDGPDAALSMVYGGFRAGKFTEAERWNPAAQNWSLRSAGWRYIIYNNGMEELYNHETDPLEWDNVLKQNPEVATQMKAEIMRMTRLKKLGIRK